MDSSNPHQGHTTPNAACGTKIVATLGPATSAPQQITRLVEAGTNVVRINFSHGSREQHESMLRAARAAAEAAGCAVAVLGDLSGPKIRLRTLAGGFAELEAGATLRLTGQDRPGDASSVGLTDPDVIADVRIGDRVLIDDGAIRLRVIALSPDALSCRCEVGGVLRDHKGVNLPDSLKVTADIDRVLEAENLLLAVALITSVVSIRKKRQAQK